MSYIGGSNNKNCFKDVIVYILYKKRSKNYPFIGDSTQRFHGTYIKVRFPKSPKQDAYVRPDLNRLLRLLKDQWS